MTELDQLHHRLPLRHITPPQPPSTDRRQLPSELFVLHPAPPRYRSAAIATLCTAGPVLAGQALDQPTVGLIASTGALAALYGGRGSVRQEATAVGYAALGLTTSIAIGSALAGYPWMAVLGTALWAAVVTAICAIAQAWPPGTVMLVLLCAVGGGLPPGQTVQRIGAVATVAACATILSSMAALATRPRDVRGHPAPSTGAPVRSGHLRRALVHFAGSPVPWMAARTGIAVGLAGAAALMCHLGRPYWAMAVAGAVLARGSYAASANTRALLRGAGTAAGCLLAGVLAALHPNGIGIALILAALTFITELVVARNYALAMIFVTPLSTILVATATHASSVLAIIGDRLVETLLGCLAAVVAGQLATSRWAVRHKQRAVMAVFTTVVDLLEDPRQPQRIAALRAARSQLLLVSERTAGERRAVRTAAATLDHAADAARSLAERALNSPSPSPRSGRIARGSPKVTRDAKSANNSTWRSP
jgi:hypothetical protein